MPKLSERQDLLNDLEDIMRWAKFDEVVRDDSSFEDDMLETPYGLAATLHYVVNQQRFLNPRTPLDKSRDYIYNYFLNQPDHEFRKITRVSRDTFNYILELIQGDDVFQNASHNKQAPLHWQVACALDRLGNDGQGVSHARSKLIWGIGKGTVHLYTRRVVRALCNLSRRFIQWPTPAERQQISRRLAHKGFKGAVGFVDGTTIPIHKKPAVGGNVFMDRKKTYSVNAQIVCDDRYRIIFLKTGQPGSFRDSRVFNSSALAQNPEVAFSTGEYLLADSAYGATVYLVPAYKERQRDRRTDTQEPRKIERFNTYLAKARVINEHVIGVLKSRWTCLRGMRIDIHEREHIHNFVHQVIACVVLHNLSISCDPWDDDDYEEEEDNGDIPKDVAEVGGHRLRPLTAGQRKRMEVRDACLAYHDRV